MATASVQQSTAPRVPQGKTLKIPRERAAQYACVGIHTACTYLHTACTAIF